MVEVYADVVVLVNFVMDFFILWIAGRLASLRISPFRLVLGALTGAVYSLVVLIPENAAAASFAAKIACSVVMVLLAYAPVSPAKFLRSIFFMYALSFIMGGSVIGTIYLTERKPGCLQAWNGAAVLANSFNYYWLLVGLGMAVLTGYASLFFLRRNWLRQNLVNGLVICIGDRKTDVDALLDTGNQLLDPLTGKPVIIVEAEALKGMLPQELLEAAGSEDEVKLAGLYERLEQGWAARLRMIPFNSVGRERGLLVGLRPDYIEIKCGNRVSICREVVIGLVGNCLTREGKYRALLHPFLLEKYV
ncbi:MAG: sigma-E processing peptidase SpoIIGA [Peptococcaceae bacterium]|nr:sigma-E processing peptidase SpoIIGA [Peptococcaceae bacterium]MDH7524350.1 sigma-E processing peptidase SpoIIGA [Peptococcaceae bacterium]